MPEPIQTPVPAADELAAQVLLLAQSRLTADLRFLSSALEQLKPIPVPALDTLFAGDGRCLYYCPETLLRTFRAQQSVPTRALLHVTLHFLLGHPFQRQEMDHRLWNLACDIAAEEVIRELEIPSCALPDDAMQDSWRSRLRDACPHLTAEAIYNFLLERQYPADVLAELTRLFARDSHALWYAAPRPGSRPAPNGQLLPAGEDEDITNETELRKTDTRDETLQQMQQRQKEARFFYVFSDLEESRVSCRYLRYSRKHLTASDALSRSRSASPIRRYAGTSSSRTQMRYGTRCKISSGKMLTPSPLSTMDIMA